MGIFGIVLYRQSEDDHIFGNATDQDNDYYDGEVEGKGDDDYDADDKDDDDDALLFSPL